MKIRDEHRFLKWLEDTADDYQEDEDVEYVDIHDRAGGNIDDAYQIGWDDAERWMARHILATFIKKDA